MQRHWIGVASADHVALGRAGDFMQVCHGKAAPLNRIKPNDGVIYYSPTQVFRTADGLLSFAAIGFVHDCAPYQVDMGHGFTPFRRDIDWLKATATRILPLLDLLEITRGKHNWGYGFRFGLLEITREDFAIVGQTMQVNLHSGVVSQAITL